jgi:dihydrofolate reductase
VKAILAVNNLGFIGLNGELPWQTCREDFLHFKKMTSGSTLLVGYNTSQKLPKLANREIIIDQKGKIFMHPDWWCIGGKFTYEKYAPFITELHVSHINDNTIGDTTFPDFFGLNPLCKVFNYHFDIDSILVKN